jgi:hypothetical protein
MPPLSLNFYVKNTGKKLKLKIRVIATLLQVALVVGTTMRLNQFSTVVQPTLL